MRDDLRDRLADAILAATYPPDEWPDGPPGEGEIDTAREQADAALAVRDDELEQLRGELAGMRDLFEAANELASARTDERDAERQRADQAEDLLRIAHDTSNRSEAERARAVQRAEQAEKLLSDASRHLRALCATGRHDHMGANLTCAACDLAHRIEALKGPR